MPSTAEVKRTGLKIGLQVQNWLFTSPNRCRCHVFFKGILCMYHPRVANCREITAGTTLWSFYFLLSNTKAIHMTRVIINLIHVQGFYQPNYNE